jgi:lipoprotein NlpI
MLALPAHVVEADAKADLRACDSAMENEAWEKVLQHCGRAIRSNRLSDKDLAVALTRRCGANGELRRPDDAIRDCDEALSLDPDSAAAYNNRGIARSDKGFHDFAIEDYGNAIRLEPGNVQAYSNRGIAFGRKGEHERAVQDFDQALRLDPDYAEAYNNRGYAHSTIGNYKAAIQDFDKAVDLDPSYVAAYGNRGRAYFYAGEFAAAAADLARFVEKRPGDAYGILWLALARMRSGATFERELAAHADDLDLSKWPGIVVRRYLGKVDDQAVLDAIGDADPKLEREQTCEAFFYLGGLHLFAR